MAYIPYSSQPDVWTARIPVAAIAAVLLVASTFPIILSGKDYLSDKLFNPVKLASGSIAEVTFQPLARAQQPATMVFRFGHMRDRRLKLNLTQDFLKDYSIVAAAPTAQNWTESSDGLSLSFDGSDEDDLTVALTVKPERTGFTSAVVTASLGHDYSVTKTIEQIILP